MDQYDDETLESEAAVAAAATAVNLVLLLVEGTQYDGTPSVNRREHRNANLRWLPSGKGLRASKHLDVEEQVAIFLLIVGHDTRFRHAQASTMRYYVAFLGRVPGVYETWEETNPQVSGEACSGGSSTGGEEAPPAVEVEEAEDVEDLGGMAMRDVYGWIFCVVRNMEQYVIISLIISPLVFLLWSGVVRLFYTILVETQKPIDDFKTEGCQREFLQALVWEHERVYKVDMTEAWSKPMNLNHKIAPRVTPLSILWYKHTGIVPAFFTSSEMIKWKKLVSAEDFFELDIWPELENLTGSLVQHLAATTKMARGSSNFKRNKLY
ncbi:hypothetical protein GIB67_036949 [Kingdonia uniflora]|uniref:Ribonuclease H1 N-terminal domain-containing protein n=1 Tax=Kingdonia uniflora TaxID=39325 RepID=A0A7J7NVP7_9MAGN|nr:hypothetical protein GIB67_036949 [Kingdonia uniflora]